MLPRMRTLLAALAATLAIASPASALEIQAHRGGTVSNGKPAYAEETLQAYEHAAANGFVLEVDAKLTRDGVPVAVHDATLDRTTTCSGEVRTYTLARLRSCRLDVLGSPGGGLRTRRTRSAGRIATIAEVLELARLTGAKVNLEIKNLPTDPDWDTTPGYANRVMDVVEASGLPNSKLLIQSFIPANLDVAKQRIPHVHTSLLTLGSGADTIALAEDKGYEWLSPQWPVPASFVADVHRAGHPVVPYTIDKRAAVKAAARAKVDALITDDPLMAAAAVGLKPARALTAKLARHPGRIEAKGRLKGAARCEGIVKLRVLGAKNLLRGKRARLKADCTYQLAVTVPRGAAAELLATVGFSGNARVLPRLVGPKPVPAEVPLAVPHGA
jgi:glycerophosphoryl diester phosphodiesterase